MRIDEAEATELESSLEGTAIDGEPVALAPPPPGEAGELLEDNPLDEPHAEVISADPSAGLAEPDSIRGAIEALLFVSPEPLTAKRISQALGEADGKAVRRALLDLQIEYDRGGRGMQILEVAGGYQMASREKYAEFIQRLGARKKPPALSGATLETLAIVAYRQPIIRAEVESVRGVESSGTIRNLLDLGLIEIVGRKEVIGRPPLYGTTEKFLRAFGLRRLEDLPSIRGLRERFADDETLAAKPSASAIHPGEATAEEIPPEASHPEEAPAIAEEGESGPARPSPSARVERSKDEDLNDSWLDEEAVDEDGREDGG